MSVDFDKYDDEELDEFAKEDNSAEIIAEFEKKVAKRIKFLVSPKSKQKPEQRIRITYWLGEVGAPKAIRVLRHIYDTERDNKPLHKAATYALGQFKALERAVYREGDESFDTALQREENADIRQLLQSVALTGEVSKRRSIPLPLLISLALAMTVSLVILAVLNLQNLDLSISSNQVDSTPTPIVGASSEHTAVLQAVADLRLWANWNYSDAQNLQQQFGVALASTDYLLVCESRFTLRRPLALSKLAARSYPALIDLAAEVNRSSKQINVAVIEHNRACQHQDGHTTYEEAHQISQRLGNLLVTLPALTESLATLETLAQNASIGPGGELILPTLVPTEIPTLEPTPTIDPDTVRTHIRVLIFNIDQVSELHTGALALLSQHWLDIRTAGSTDACYDSQPLIPDDYLAIEPEILANWPELGNAQRSVNLAMQMLRDSWALFYAGCNTGNFTNPDVLNPGSMQAQASADALSAARATLDTLSATLGQ